MFYCAIAQLKSGNHVSPDVDGLRRGGGDVPDRLAGVAARGEGSHVGGSSLRLGLLLVRRTNVLFKH